MMSGVEFQLKLAMIMREVRFDIFIMKYKQQWFPFKTVTSVQHRFY